MDKGKIGDCVHDLKIFFNKKGATISEARETIYRLLDYIDKNYSDDDERDKPFKLNGLNGNINKEKIHHKGVKLEVKTR
jgi:hypothetical protein